MQKQQRPSVVFGSDIADSLSCVSKHKVEKLHSLPAASLLSSFICFRLAGRIQHERLKSDFTIDWKHEVLWTNFQEFH